MKKFLIVCLPILLINGFNLTAQTGTYNILKLTGSYDQLRFEAPGQDRYFFFSKTFDANDKAFALYSPEDGGYFTYWKENTADMIVYRGKVGVGTSNPNSKVEIKSSGTIAGNISSSNSYLSLTDGNNFLIMDPNEIYSSGSVNFGAYNGEIRFRLLKESGVTDPMVITSAGRVGIGTSTTGTHKLAVDGTIGAREVKVETGTWSDFVFEEDYKLRSLGEVENYIQQHKHLPDVPGEEEVLENGIELGKMDAKLLQKIEELTLYIIEQEKKIDSLEATAQKVERLEQKVNQLLKLMEDE